MVVFCSLRENFAGHRQSSQQHHHAGGWTGFFGHVCPFAFERSLSSVEKVCTASGRFVIFVSVTRLVAGFTTLIATMGDAMCAVASTRMISHSTTAAQGFPNKFSASGKRQEKH